MSTIQERLNGKLVVSCQADPGNPLENTDVIRRMARVVVEAGAEALRINSAEHIAAIRQDTDVPIIGIQKRHVNGKLRITPDFSSAVELASAGASIIALDCTNRKWEFGDPWQVLIQRIHNELKLPVMADTATLEEAVAAAEGGADFVGTTLNGYTEDTCNNHSFSWSLLADLAKRVSIPIIAEGHISTPEEAKRALAEGASCVVVGSAITRPGNITANFLRVLRPGNSNAQAIGVDLGGTSIKAGIVDHAGQVTHSVKVSTEASKGRTVIAAQLVTAIQQVLKEAHEAGIVPCGLGVATAGAVTDRDGSIFAATDNLPGWAGFGLREFVEERFHLPTCVINDAHAAALAELYFGLGRSLSNFVAITVGTGIGSGIISNGQLLSGQHGFAGTIGHQTIRMDGRPCNCGRRGCLEAYVSTAALLQEYTERAPKAAIKRSDSDGALAFEIGRLASAGDPIARQAYEALANYLAEGIANIFNLIDPQAVLLSGGLVEGYPDFVPYVEKRVIALLHFGKQRAPHIKLATAGYFAGVQGVGGLVLRKLA